MDNHHIRMKETVLRSFFGTDGRLKQLPVQLKKRLIVLEQLALQLEEGRLYEEKEINEHVKRYHEDFATIRREFIMHRFMSRENSIYALNPREQWLKWEELR